MDIRPLSDSDDKLKISRIYEESWNHAYKGIVPQSFLDSISEGRWVPHLSDPGISVLVMAEGGEYIGVSTFCPSRFSRFPDYGELVSLYLLPEYMGRGMGSVLLDASLKALSEAGFTNVLLWVLEDNLRAHKFYEESGFINSGETIDDEIDGKPLRELAYIKPEK